MEQPAARIVRGELEIDRHNFKWSVERNGWFVDLWATHVGRKDQFFSGTFLNPGKAKISASWDQIPLLFSQTTETLYRTEGPRVLRLDDDIQLGFETLTSDVTGEERCEPSLAVGLCRGSATNWPPGANNPANPSAGSWRRDGCTPAREDHSAVWRLRGLTCRWSRRGECFDNVVMEAWFSASGERRVEYQPSHRRISTEDGTNRRAPPRG